MADTILCSVGGCNNNILIKSRRLCSTHYQRWQRHGDTSALRIRGQEGTVCSVGGCNKEASSKRMCSLHYQRVRKTGSTEPPKSRPNLKLEWIERHATYDGKECLKFPFPTSDNGRGTVNVDGTIYTAPRYMCILAHGQPPSNDYHAAHHCGLGHKGCVNPKHLRWATPSENEMDKLVHGTLRRGSKVNTSKLSERDVREIRKLRASHSVIYLAKKYNVTSSAIYSIMKRKNWAWLD